MAVTPHFDGRRFFNPTGANGKSFTAVPRMLVEKRTPWPRHVPVEQRRPPRPERDDELIVTFVGHSTFLLQTTAGNVLTDPIYSTTAGPLPFIGPRRVRRPAVAFDDLPEIALILLSHNHYDHCDLPTLRALARRHQSLVVTPVGNGRLVRTAGFRRVEEIDWWQATAAAPWPIVAMPAQHFSARTPFDRNRALWASFVLSIAGRRLFFGGDSGYGPHFRAIKERSGPIDLALLPIGAYEPRWFMKDIHMNPDEAVQAHLDLGARQSIGMHFGTFQLTTESIDAPIEALARARQAHGLAEADFRALEFGESLRVRCV